MYAVMSMSVSEVCCTPLHEGAIDVSAATEMAPLLAALADPVRLRIISILVDSADGSCCGCDLEQPLGLSQPTISHHLKVLREAGLVSGEREGRWVHYRVVDDRLRELSQALLPKTVVV